MRQKDVFLESEGDAWFERNRAACAQIDPATDPVVAVVLDLARQRPPGSPPLRLLEVGCGEGRRLAWLSTRIGAEVHGLDPSAKAVAAAQGRGVAARQGTADALPHADGAFDVLVFGFCLYLCDPQDLFRIAQEADRVLADPAWLIIHDFHAPAPLVRPYHHKPGVHSRKMDFRRLFDWHPAYTCYAHRVSAHGGTAFCDDPQEWVAVSTLRKRGGDHA